MIGFFQTFTLVNKYANPSTELQMKCACQNKSKFTNKNIFSQKFNNLLKKPFKTYDLLLAYYYNVDTERWWVVTSDDNSDWVSEWVSVLSSFTTFEWMQTKLNKNLKANFYHVKWCSAWQPAFEPTMPPSFAPPRDNAPTALDSTALFLLLLLLLLLSHTRLHLNLIIIRWPFLHPFTFFHASPGQKDSHTPTTYPPLPTPPYPLAINSPYPLSFRFFCNTLYKTLNLYLFICFFLHK